MNKARLMAEVEGLRARVAALELDGLASAHLEKLALAAAPLERRLKELPELEARAMRWDAIAAERELSDEEVGQFKHAIMRLTTVRLDARETSALNQLYRQQAEVIGVLRGRRGTGRYGEQAEALKPEPPAPVRPELPLERAGRIVQFGARDGA